MKKFILIKLALFLLLSGIQLSQISLAETTPESVVNRLHQSLIQAMQESKALDYNGRYEVLEPVILESFDFETIARIVMGRYWKKLDDQQKTEFIDIFSRLSIATYTAQFDSFSGESFEYLEDEEMKKGRVLVKTKLVTNDRAVPFNYVLHPLKDRWRIINVIVDGVSDLSLKRADYTTTMKAEGFDGLISKLQEKLKFSSAN